MNTKNELTGGGRLTRGGFWLRHLAAVPVLLFAESVVATRIGRPADLVPAVLLLAYLIATWIRRLHDRNRSGWWLLIVVIPVAGPLFLIVECAFRGSRLAANRYGGAPMGTAHYLIVR